MAAKKLQTEILFIEKDRFEIYLPDKKSVIPFEFLPEIVKDSEILDREQLYTQVKSFIEKNKLSSSSLVAVLAKNILFEKDFIKGQGTDEEQKIQAQQFVESIPFESIGSISVPLEKGFRVIASNADLYESILGIFKLSGFSLVTVLAVSLFGGNIEKLTPETGKILLQRLDSFKRYSMVSETSSLVAVKEEEVVKKKKNIYMILASLGMFFAAGILVIYAVFFLK